jgi:hypothetical protein
MRVGDVICCNLNAESCAKEASRLQGFCDGDVVDVSVKGSGGVKDLDFPDFSPFLASFCVAAMTSLKALAMALMASLLVMSVAFLASLIL